MRSTSTIINGSLGASRWLTTAACAFFLFAGPLAVLLAAALGPRSDGFGNVVETVLATYFSNSAIVIAGSIFTALALGAPAAWLTQRYDFPGRKFAVLLQCLPLTISASDAAGLYLEAWSHPIVSSRLALSLTIGAGTAPWIYLILRVALASIPSRLGDAARTLGHGPVSRFLRVDLPLVAVPLLAGTALVAMETLADFGAANRMGIATLSVGLQQQWIGLQETGMVFSFGALLLLAAFVVALPLAVALLRNRGPSPALRAYFPERAHGLKAFAIFAACLALAAPGFLVPAALSVNWAVEKIGRGRLESLYRDTFGTIMTAALVTLICATIALLIAWLTSTGENAARDRRLLWVSVLSLVPPPVVYACLVLAVGGALGDFLLQGRAGIVLTDVVRLLPFMLVPVLDRMDRIPVSLGDSARMLGCTARGAFFRAILPQLSSVLAAGSILTFVLTAKELTASVMLQPFGYHAISLKIFALTGTQQTRESSIWILCSVIVCIYPIWALSSLLDKERRHSA